MRTEILKKKNERRIYGPQVGRREPERDKKRPRGLLEKAG
jgi:hypothetical protein